MFSSKERVYECDTFLVVEKTASRTGRTNAIANGHLSSEYSKSTPPNAANIVNPRSATVRGQTKIGNINSTEVVKKIKAI